MGNVDSQTVSQPAEPQSWAQRFLLIALGLLGVSLPAIWLFVGYQGHSLNELISFKVSDGWCTALEAYHGHCFGDYAVIDDALALGDWWGPDSPLATPYPAASWLPSILMTRIGEAAGRWSIGRDLFLALLAASLLTPAIWVAWRRWSRKAVVALVLLGVATAPFLMTMDRGNSTGLIVAPLLGVAVAYSRGRHWWLLIFIVACTLLKPQMILLVLLFVANRRYLFVLWTSLLSAALSAAAFLLFPGSLWQNISDWYNVINRYTDYQSIDAVYPYNLSVSRSLLTLLDGAGFDDAAGSDNYLHAAAFLRSHNNLIGYGLLACVLVVFAWRGSRANPLFPVLALCAVIAIIPGTSYGYYVAFMLVPAALLLRNPVKGPRLRQRITRYGTMREWTGVLDEGRADHSGLGAGAVRWLIVSALALLLTPLAIPLIEIPPLAARFQLGGATPSLIQLFWGPLMLLTFVLAIVGMILPNPGAAAADDSGAAAPVSPIGLETS